MRFYTDTEEYVFKDNSQYPAHRPVTMMQVKDKSAGGVTHIETYALPVPLRILTFALMGHEDYQGSYNWFMNVANGMANIFNFEDERGAIFTVRFNSPTFSLREISYLRYAGSLPLEILS